jgi:glutamate carboxypeptidase
MNSIELTRKLARMHVLSAVVAIQTLSFVSPSYARPDGRVLAAAGMCEPKARALLRELVQIDSGTNDATGVNAIGAILRAELENLGAKVQSVSATAPGLADNVVATLIGTGKGHILLIAHMDTVFPRGTAAERPYKVVGDHGIGPGAGDDKNGIVSAVCALRVVHELKYRDFARITLVLNSNEETGSVGSRDLIRAKAKDNDVVINLERGVPPDGLEVTRKGSAAITVEIIGRAAHAGLEPEKGRNAIIEASHQSLQLGSLADSAKETTVNVTMIQGGNALNVIPDHAVVRADVRAFTPQEFDRVETGLARLASDTIVPDVQVKASMTRNFPPWPPSASTHALLARAQKLYAEIGRKLAGVPVGSSADVAFAAETGTPCIDGVAILGGGAHGLDDYADLSSITPRVYLLTRMLMDLGRNPSMQGH